jgi:type I restriction enzyme S subunit
MPQNKKTKNKNAADSSTANQKPNSPTAKPGFKLTKLGWIPEEWEVVRLEDMTSNITSGSRGWAKYYDEVGESFFVRITNLNRESVNLDFSKPKFVTLPEGGTEGQRTRLRNRDILISVTADLGIIGLWNDNDFEDAYISQHVALVRLSSKTQDAKYVAIQLSGPRLQRHIALQNDAGAKAGMNLRAIARIPIPIPSFLEQTKIANCLSTWDRAITTTRKLLQQLEERKKGLMQGLLSGAVRVPGFIGEWEETRIGSLILESKIIGEGNKVDRRIKVRLDLNGVLARDVKGNESIDSTTYYRRSAGQFIYGKQNLHKGAMGLIPSYLDGFESTSDVPAFDFKRGVDPDWFLFYMARPNFYKWLEVISTGTGSKRIQPKVLFKVKINLPTLPEQAAIAKILTTADQEIVLYKRKLAKLEAQKKGLMQQLLTGQKRLSA